MKSTNTQAATGNPAQAQSTHSSHGSKTTHYVKELPTENGFKRYELTQSGKEFLEEQTKIREKFRTDTGFMTNPFFDRFFSNKYPRKKQIKFEHP